MCDNYDQTTANLWKVFDIYKQAGILDESIIVENIAFFALVWHFRNDPSLPNYYGSDLTLLEEFNQVTDYSISIKEVSQTLEHILSLKQSIYVQKYEQSIIPSPPTDLDKYQQREVASLLLAIFSFVPDLGEWFDKYLIPRLSTNTRGGRYATPRHLVTFLARLVNLSSEDTLADLACGTGGFLVSNGVIQHATGVEISPNMARLALTNLILHGQEQHNLYLGNTFHVAWSDTKFKGTQFDSILMNPPFGMSIEPSLITDTFGGLITGRSETLFTSLAYEKLKEGGRMAVMVPSGVLFSNSSGERILRDIVIEDNAIKAIISLPKDALQPFSSLPTHILVAQKPVEEPTEFNDIWFYQTRYDGYTSGRNRQPNPEHNDLPIIQAAVSSRIGKPGKTTSASNVVRVKPFLEKKNLLGYQIWSEGDTAFRVTNLAVQNRVGPLFLVEIGESNINGYIYAHDGKVFQTEDVENSVLFKLPSKLDATGQYSFVDEKLAGITIHIGENSITFRKGKTAHAEEYQLVYQGKDTPIAFVVDANGKVISPAVHIENNWLKSEKAPYSLALEDIDKATPAFLLLFPGGLKAIPLVGNKGKKVFLFHIDGNWGIFNPAKRRFYIGAVKEVFRTDAISRGILVDVQGTILGVSIKAGEIWSSKSRDLQPGTYMPQQQVIQEKKSPAQLMAEIKINQNQLMKRIDHLMGIAEIQSIADSDLPPKVLRRPVPPSVRGIQKMIWDEIQKKTKDAADYKTPLPFQAVDLVKSANVSVSVADVQRTLELFERMGMIVSVSYQGMQFYRLPVERDFTKGGLE